MEIRERAITVNGLTLWLVLSSVFCGTGAVLKTLYTEDLCYWSPSTKLSLRYQNSAILNSVPNGPLDCEITLEPERDSFVVIAFYQYNLGPDDSLTFRDRHNFKLSLGGEGFFHDERKTLLFEGPLTIHYVTNNTHGPNSLKFQLVYTQVHDEPCDFHEFKCRNNKCIPKDLACDSHNHCGDVRDQKDCGTFGITEEKKLEIPLKLNPWILTIIVCGVILFIVVLTFTIVFIQRLIAKKKKESQSPVPAAAPTSPIQNVAPPSAVGHVSQSFPSIHHAYSSAHQTASESFQTRENYEVPSMYPQLPSAPVYEGYDNPEFIVDE